MIIPHFKGGLCNLIFQMASVYSIAKKGNHSIGIINNELKSPHSDLDYFQNILKNFAKYRKDPRTINASKAFILHDSNPLLFNVPPGDEVIFFTSGYFQIEKLIRPYRQEFIDMLHFDTSVLSKYPEIYKGYFIHIRRGDYLKVYLVNVFLDIYYKRAMNKIDPLNLFTVYVFSNDIEWCKSCDLLKGRKCIFVDENEVDSLLLMSKCGLGGIAANSTFSWWGLYLNLERPHLYVPNKWFNTRLIDYKNYICDEFTEISVV